MKIKKILVSQPKPSSEKSPYYDLVAKYGVEIVFRPFIKVEGLTSKEFRQSKVPINAHTAVIFTTRTAVDHYFRLCKELRFDVPDTMKYFCLSETIANYLQKYIIYRKRKIFFSPTGHADGLLPLLQKHAKEKYIYPMSDVHDTKLSTIDEINIHYVKAVMYRTVNNDFGPDEVLDYDMLIFFTPSGIKSLKDNFPQFEQGDIAIGAMGNKTIEEVKNDGLRLDVTVSPGAPSMAAAIAQYLENHIDDPESDRKPLKPIAAERKALEDARRASEEAERRAVEEAERKKRSEASKKAAATRRAKKAAQDEAARKRSEAAKKAAATRRAKKAAEEAARLAAEEAARKKRSEASKKAAATRRAMKAAQEEAARKRSEAAKKAAATRRAKKAAAQE